MKVIIAEKSSVVCEIARVFGANGREDEYLEGNDGKEIGSYSIGDNVF